MDKRWWSLIVVAAAAGCGGSSNAPAPAASGSGAVAVTLVRPERAAVQRVVEQPGLVQAYEETRLFARVPGYVRRLAAEMDIGRTVRGPRYDSSGKEVEPGEVLAELVVPELEEEARLKEALVAQATAEVDQARKALDSAVATIAVVQAAVLEAQANSDRWESESRRMTGLVKERVVDTQSGEETLNQYRAASSRLATAKAAVLKATAERERADADVRTAQAREVVARADARKSAAMLGYAAIRAPFDGVVTARRVNTGDFVQPTGGTEDWLFRISRQDRVRVVVMVPEADAGRVGVSANATIAVAGAGVAARSATVTRNSWALEAGSRTLRVEFDQPNADGALRPGMFVQARIRAESPVTWTVPAAALVRQGDEIVGFRVEGGKAVRTPLRVGRGDGRLVEVLQRGLPGIPESWEAISGDETLVVPAAGLSDGQEVTVAPAK